MVGKHIMLGIRPRIGVFRVSRCFKKQTLFYIEYVDIHISYTLNLIPFTLM